MDTIRIEGINFIRFKSLPTEKLFAFSTTVQGGVSTATYSSLNLSPYSGDDPDCVDKNQEYVANLAGISVDNLYIPYQIHKDKIAVIEEGFLQKTDLEKADILHGVDAVITNQKDICIGVTTADCVPVLIYDPQKHILATIHAGWKGTVAKIAQKTILTMEKHFGCDPQTLLAGIGPCISQKHFEVGDEVVEAFREAGFDIDKIAYKNKESGKMHINLQDANKIILTNSGLLPGNIETAGLCTYSNPGMFFSARRQTIHSGRMFTGGVLR